MSWELDTSPPQAPARFGPEQRTAPIGKVAAAAQPERVAAKWRPGQRRREVIGYAVCCPGCGCDAVGMDDNGKSADRRRWSCNDCGHSWQEPAALVIIRLKIVKT